MAMQGTIDVISLAVLVCVLAASIRIIAYRSFEHPSSRLVYLLTHPAWCLTLLFFIPWTIAGFAKSELSYLPWQAFADHSENGMLDAAAFFLCVLVVDLWMFVAAGQLAVMVVNNNPNLSAAEKNANQSFFIAANLLMGFLIVMQANNLYFIYEHVTNTTLYFIAAITLLAIYFHARFTPFVVAKSPAILTACGILGTFIGVAIGLMEFDPNAVQRSVPALIDGIKTAFWASACGIFFALTIKLREVFCGGGRVLTAKSRATIDDLVTIMESIQQALVGGQGHSLHSLAALARQENNARMDTVAQLLETLVRQQQQQLQPAEVPEPRKSIALASQY